MAFFKKRKKKRKDESSYSMADFVGDVLFYLPEVILLPFRILFYLLRGIFRAIGSLFDGI